MESASLADKSVRATIWSGADLLCRHGTQFVIGILLARLLDPADFGVIGMLSIFTGVGTVLVDSGFGSALIQKKQITPTETSSVFYFNQMIGLGIALALCGSASWISDFYALPILKPLTRLMALNLFLGSFGSVHIALLTRDLDFHTQTKISFISAIISGSIAVLLAYYGWGVWALAAQVLAYTCISTVLLWIFRPWRPSFIMQFSALRSLFTFGSYILFSGLLDITFSRSNTLIIGKLYSARELGFYTQGFTIQQIPATIVTTVVSRVTFPLFSTVAEDKETMKKGVRKALTWLMMINLPMMLGIVGTSRPLVMTIFGGKWESCIPFVQVLSFAGVFWPLHIVNLNVLKALGRSNLYFRLEIIKKIISLAALLAVCRISVLAMAWSQVGLAVACYLLNAYYTGALLGYPVFQQMRDIAPYVVSAGLMLLCVWPIADLSSLSSGAQLAVQCIAGVVLYVALCSLFRLKDFMDAVRLILGKVQQRHPA